MRIALPLPNGALPIFPIAAAAASRRKAKILQRTPSWADHDKIRQFYILAKDLTDFTGVEHEVDHIYPLQGRNVSGFTLKPIFKS
jgi:hypothetical protein